MSAVAVAWTEGRSITPSGFCPALGSLSLLSGTLANMWALALGCLAKILGLFTVFHSFPDLLLKDRKEGVQKRSLPFVMGTLKYLRAVNP